MKKNLFFFFVFILCLPLSVSLVEGANYEIPLQEPLLSGEDNAMLSGDTGMDLVTKYIKMIYTYGASILGIICVLIIVISGIQISMGGAQADLVSSAKTRIFQALLSLAILFLSAVILKTINPGFFTIMATP